MDKLPKTWAGPQRRVKRIREQRALEAIIAGCLRGVDWNKVYEKVDAIERRKRAKRNQDMEKDGLKIF
jgi:hypothetical protein